jgi:hypothetical protein
MGSEETSRERMSDEQIRIIAEAMADVEGALDKVDPALAERIRAEQEDVADTRRRALNNSEILDTRYSSLGGDVLRLGMDKKYGLSS